MIAALYYQGVPDKGLDDEQKAAAWDTLFFKLNRLSYWIRPLVMH